MSPIAIILTVGTSLLHSATWDWPGKPKFMDEVEWEQYQKYFLSVGETGGLWFPEKRKQCGELVESCFRASLKAGDAAEWSTYVPDYQGGDNKYRRRYSAEITSLLAFGEKFQRGEGWQTYLNGADIFWACDEIGVTFDCASHLLHISSGLLHGSLDKIKYRTIAGFSSYEPEKLLRGLDDFDEFVWELIDSPEDYNEIHIIVSGGYKVYAIKALNHLPSGRLKVHYMHEEADIIFTHSYDPRQQDGQGLPVSVEVQQ